MAKVKIKLLADNDMVPIAKKAIRGGLTRVVTKHGIANNKYLPYDKTKKCVFTIFGCKQSIRLCNESKVTVRRILMDRCFNIH